MTIGENLRKIRKEKKLTQKQLGKLCGINEVQIRQYELGKANPKIETVSRIAKALDVPVSVLRTGEKDTIIIGEMFSSNMPIMIPKSIKDSDRKKFEYLQTIENLLDQLNPKGQDKAMEQVEMLTKIPEYQKTEERKKPSEDSNILVAAHARTDIKPTPEDLQHDLDIMNDDNWE